VTARFEARVYYEDTDAGGIVYHARYLAFAERARTEALRAAGVPHDQLSTQYGLIFVVRRVEMDYWAPARLDDVVVVTTRTLAVGGASVRLRQEFAVGGTAIGVLDVRLACVGRADGRPARMPERWRGALAAGVAGTVVE
jgi:acyl-CoA thioester hydrolase